MIINGKIQGKNNVSHYGDYANDDFIDRWSCFAVTKMHNEVHVFLKLD